MNKEKNILELFFNEPTKHWHFKNIVEKAVISEQRANLWLKRLIKKGLITRVKPRGRMPYYIANYNSSVYRNEKKIYALNFMLETGLLAKLDSLKKAKTVVIFGSFSRSDWGTKSDIDVFVYGDPGKLKYGDIIGKRSVEVHACRTKMDIKAIESGLLNSVIKGYFVKGSVHDLVEVEV